VNWLKNIFRKPEPAAVPVTPGGAVPQLAPRLEAKRISTQSVDEWCERLEREGNRTGNARLLQQARNIRTRLGAS
jgi:hypothetical protein